MIAFATLAVLCPVGVCGGGYFFFRSWLVGSAKSLPKEIELARRAGLPVEVKDLRPAKPIPDDQNAAVVYRPFCAHIQEAFKKKKDLTKALDALFKGSADANQSKLATDTVNENRESLNEVVAASRRPFCDFHYRYEMGASLLLPEFAQAKDAARLLRTRAYLEARTGKVELALEDLAAIERIGHHMGQTPMLIAALVQFALDGIAQAEFTDVLQTCSHDASMLVKANKVLAEFGPPPDLRYAFRGEVAMGRIMIQSVKSTNDIAALGDGRNDSPDIPLPASMRDGSEANMLAAWRQIYTEMPNDQRDWRGMRKLFKKVNDRMETDQSLANKLALVVFPSLDGTALALASHHARQNLSATTIRLLQDRLRSGSFPSALPNYGPLSIDPFDGKPLRYRHEGTGFVLYSIDRDLEDNGGRKKKGNMKGDIVVTIR